MSSKVSLKRKRVSKVFWIEVAENDFWQMIHLLFKILKHITGLSDLQKLVLTVVETGIVKNKPQEMQCRKCKFFDYRKFNRDLTEEFSHVRVYLAINLIYFWKYKTGMRHWKRKHLEQVTVRICLNHLGKLLRKKKKEMLLWKRVFLKRDDLSLYRKQNNYCSRLYKKGKRFSTILI